MRRLLMALFLTCLILPASAQAPPPKPAPGFPVPFRLTETKHVLVRAKINGKGPFNFIMDTGAPALFVGTAVCKQLGVTADNDGWGTFDRFEVEGGLVIARAQGKIEDPFQLEGMNRMGLAGVELHGVLGYNLLARYRIELDFTKDRMTWTPLPFEPGLPEGLTGKAPGGVDAMAGMAKVMSLLVGKKGVPETKPRGVLGVEWADKDGVTITAVHKDSPAAVAGLLPGDRLTHVEDKEVKTRADLQRQAAALTAGTRVRLTVQRGQETRNLVVPLGKGF